jgi:hypothetical protein
LIFTVPGMLWTLPLVGVPIVIHLLQRRRFRKVQFSAMEFLQRALRRTRRRILLEDMILLLLRTLAVLLLILALARPSSEGLPLALGRDARAELIVLDASMSMDFRNEDQSTYERALAIAGKRLGELDAGLDDRAAIIRAGLATERIASGDPNEVQAALRELQRPDAVRGDLTGALLAAIRTVSDLALETGQVRVTILTDLQANLWNQDSSMVTPLEELVALGCAVELVDCGVPPRNNIAVTALTLSSARLVRGDSCTANVVLRNFGNLPKDVQATLLIDDSPVATRKFSLSALEQRDWNVPLSPMEVGARAVEVRLQHDQLLADDSRTATLTVDDGLQVVLVGQEASPQQAPGVFDALQRYLQLGEQAPLRPRAVPVLQLTPADVAEADLLVLADPGTIPPRVVQTLVPFVARGGGLLLAVGPQTGQAELQLLLDALGSVGVGVGEVVSNQESPARVAIAAPEHAALRFFSDQRWQPLLTEVPHYSYRPIAVDPRAATPAATVLRFLTANAEIDSGAALVDWEFGYGRVALLAAAPHGTWNRMEEVPGGTLPLLYDLLFSLAPQPGYRTAYEVGASLAVTLDFPPTDTELINPDGARRSQVAAVSILAEGRHRLELVAAVPQPGIWILNTHLLLPDGAEAPLSLRLAVVPPALESDLRASTPEELRSFLPKSIRLGRPEDLDDEGFINNHLPRDLMRTLLFLLLACLVSETLLATMLDRRRT